ncbi:MAG: enoyl-CoA hydratase [Cellvibrionaceae bacterium]|nr:enoyl-CoA hydratase [Cellvibrionaceae bacterium]|tara:strand:- start:5530 stop:6345 length:816 start_codon:yes stop_codon:yes gene_type:complete
MSTESPEIAYEIVDRVGTITMQSSNRRNSLTVAFVKELGDLIKQANDDNRVGSILITGQEGAFSAGGDMSELFYPRLNGDEPYAQDDPYTGGLGLLSVDWTRLMRDSKPIVVAFNGYAVGGGMTFFLAADVLVASPKASFHFVFTQVGIVAEMCSTKYLPARVGFGRASELLLQARTIDGNEAKTIGLVDYLFDHDKLFDESLAIAKQIAKQPPSMLKMTKKLLDQNYLETDTDKVWKRESDALKNCWANPEHKEAINAFLEKRAPNFNDL